MSSTNPVHDVAMVRVDVMPQDFDVQTLFLALSLERAEYLDIQMKDQAAEMQQKNQVLREATAALTAARIARQKAEKDDGATDEPAEYKAFYDKYAERYPDLVKKDMTGDRDHKAIWNELANKYPALRDEATKNPGILGKEMTFAQLLRKENPGLVADSKHNAKEWDVNIESLKGFIDFHNSQSQTDMIKLQSLQNKFNQCFESASNQMSKQAKSLDTVIANLR